MRSFVVNKDTALWNFCRYLSAREVIQTCFFLPFERVFANFGLLHRGAFTELTNNPVLLYSAFVKST